MLKYIIFILVIKKVKEVENWKLNAIEMLSNLYLFHSNNIVFGVLNEGKQVFEKMKNISYQHLK